LILNNLEYDHADIFPDLDAIKLQFSHLLRTVPNNGHIIVNGDDKNIPDVLATGCWTPVTFFAEYDGGNDSALWQWQALKQDGSMFCLYHKEEKVIEVTWSMIGIHNISNACAVAVAASSLGIPNVIIQQGFESFTGIRRRMSLIGEACGIRVFDDFAHHPTAIKGVVAAAKYAMLGDLSRKGKLWVVVEPRSNTMRSRIHQVRLAQCFEGADKVMFTPASDRGLESDDVLDTALLCRNIGTHAQVLSDASEIISALTQKAQAGDDVLILSNGGFDDIHQRLLRALRR